jgi:hypothetical protein
MANIFRIIGTIGLVLGIVTIGWVLLGPRFGQPPLPLAPLYLNQAVAAIVGGIIALGLGQLIAVAQRVEENTAGILDYVRGQESSEPAEAAPAQNGHDVFANVPDYSPRRDPPIVKEGTYRDHTILTLEDGTVAIQTTAGWKRFRRVRDFDRLLSA